MRKALLLGVMILALAAPEAQAGYETGATTNSYGTGAVLASYGTGARPAALEARPQHCYQPDQRLVSRHTYALCRAVERRVIADRPSPRWRAAWTADCRLVARSTSRCTWSIDYSTRSRARHCDGAATVAGRRYVSVKFTSDNCP